MIKTGHLILIIILFTAIPGCRKKYQNMVPIEQIDIDNSNDYNQIFKKDIEEEKRRSERFKENPFRE